MPPSDPGNAPAIRLPGGSEAEVRPLRGTDEEWVASLPPDLSEPEFVTALLARAVRVLDGKRAGVGQIRKLTPGDRDFLLLQVARLTFGSSVELLLTCPEAACRARMHAAFDIQRAPVTARPVQASYRLDLPDGREMIFRLPVGEDQEAAVTWSGLTHEEKRVRLLARCLPAGADISGDGASQILSDGIQAAAPMVDLDFSALCPECGGESVHRLEPARWLIAELRRRFPGYERDVHLLSLHYHWPLRKVLSMPRARRRRWVKLLTRELDSPATALGEHS
jgi:hypothetical protein